MKDEAEILWRFYLDYVTHARHHQTLRATTSTILLAIAGGVLALIGKDKIWPLPRGDLPLALFLIGLGVFGALFIVRYHEQYSFYLYRARSHREALEKEVPQLNLSSLRKEADIKT
jgi:hypothetical protein